MTVTLPSGHRAFRFFGRSPQAQAIGVVDDVTRRLCAATYLDNDFAYRVIAELTEDGQRAVPPSYDFDVRPVLQHAFRARRRLLGRDIILSVLLLTGFVLFPSVTLAWLLFAIAWRQWRGANRSGQPGPAITALALFFTAAVVLCCGFFITPLLALTSGASTTTGGYGSPYDTPDTAINDAFASAFGTAVLTVLLVLPILITVGTYGTLTLSKLLTYRHLVDNLRAGRTSMPPTPPNQRIAERLAWLGGAQYGNVVLHSQNPLMGSGTIVSGWSMALTLRPKAPEPTGNGAGRHGAGRADQVQPVDPLAVSAAALQQSVRHRTFQLQDRSLPESRRVPGITIRDQIVADGERPRGDPLVDPQTMKPLQHASTEAIVSVLEQPQGGVRHYLRIGIGGGKAVHANDGEVVLPAQQQEIAVSAFVHVAVEGGKLYAEFVGAVMPPIKKRFQLVDKLHPATGSLFLRAAGEAFGEWIDSVAAPRRVVRTIRQIIGTGYRAEAAYRAVQHLPFHDYGARLSVRELAAEPHPTTFLQDLDATKYLKIIEKTVLETLLDDLDAAGVDTSEYRSQMNFIQNNNAVFSNNTFNGPTAVGSSATAMGQAKGQR